MHNLANEFGISLRRGAIVVMHGEEWGSIDGIREQFFWFYRTTTKSYIVHIHKMCYSTLLFLSFFLMKCNLTKERSFESIPGE